MRHGQAPSLLDAAAKRGRGGYWVLFGHRAACSSRDLALHSRLERERSHFVFPPFSRSRPGPREEPGNSAGCIQKSKQGQGTSLDKGCRARWLERELGSGKVLILQKAAPRPADGENRRSHASWHRPRHSHLAAPLMRLKLAH